MNERIIKLAYEAGMRSPDLFKLTVSHMSIGTLEKFAELIIQDCIDCVDGYTKPRTFGTHYEAVEQIKSNFGVE